MSSWHIVLGTVVFLKSLINATIIDMNSKEDKHMKSVLQQHDYDA